MLSPAALADTNTSILKQETRMQISGEDVLITELMMFPKDIEANIRIDIPKDAESIIAKLDNTSINITSAGALTLPVNNTKYAAISYTRTGMLEDSTFIGSFTAPVDITALRIKLTLPEKAILTKPMEDDWGPTRSVLPKPKRIDTDGTSMTIIWEFADVSKDQDIALYVNYQQPRSNSAIIAGAFIAAFAIIFPIVFLVIRHRTKARNAGKRPPQHRKDINEHLKESEQQIVNILRLKKGSCEQGTLRIATGFSKAKVSGLLREMEARNIIHKEKRGNRNLVFLKA